MVDEKKTEVTPKQVFTQITLSILGRIRRATGKQYPRLESELKNLSAEAQQELGRLLIDLEAEKMKATNDARMFPWKR
jgi:hypothetical protein